MGKITLITGGVRSGKSAYALSCAEVYSGKKAFIATAVPFDTEMEERVKNHQSERGNRFTTIEEPYDLHKSVSELDDSITVAVIDCLTVWLGNLFYKYNSDITIINSEIDKFIHNISKSNVDMYIVTNEVGWGIVPDNKLSRSFRDCKGFMNQKIATCADNVFLCTCGIPLKVK
jgi:adenosylcobinamide kinase/adenosylcobinamide-phosphate guanylyltransferase